jgi:hypothetical protein
LWICWKWSQCRRWIWPNQVLIINRSNWWVFGKWSGCTGIHDLLHLYVRNYCKEFLFPNILLVGWEWLQCNNYPWEERIYRNCFLSVSDHCLFIARRKFTFLKSKGPIPMAARSKAQVCGRALAGIVGSYPTGDTDVCLVQCLCCQIEVSATVRSLVQRSPTDCGVCMSVIKWNHRTLDTYCDQVGRRGRAKKKKKN